MKLKRIESNSMVDMVFHLKWKSDTASHTDAYQASRINIWRDYFPNTLLDTLEGKQAGESFEIKLDSDELLPKFSKRNLIDIRRNQFDPARAGLAWRPPSIGRFYPRGILKDLAGIFKGNIRPFRCVEINNGHLKVDLNHPLAGRNVTMSGIVGKVEDKKSERGGTSVDWLGILTDGPGMQSRWHNRQTDFFSDQAFKRIDESPDSIFYGEPRLVQHIDDTAIEMIKNTYDRFLHENMNVLDLMSSWTSHLPKGLKPGRVVGVGLNDRELKKNSRLGERIVHDLNLDPQLPFASESFDSVICSVSVEYLIQPVEVFKEVARLLRQDGYFIVTFSNRWFPTKAIQIWRDLHEFERMGMVLEYFLRSKRFKNLQTYSIRGLPRPHKDRYFPDLPYSDPMYAVWGQKR